MAVKTQFTFDVHLKTGLRSPSLTSPTLSSHLSYSGLHCSLKLPVYKITPNTERRERANKREPEGIKRERERERVQEKNACIP